MEDCGAGIDFTIEVIKGHSVMRFWGRTVDNALKTARGESLEELTARRERFQDYLKEYGTVKPRQRNVWLTEAVGQIYTDGIAVLDSLIAEKETE